ncbi:MAG: AAA family ATPase [Phycisphaerae bacterium]|nr:AAA family ATPase [Phycisphaerae bacterium]
MTDTPHNKPTIPPGGHVSDWVTDPFAPAMPPDAPPDAMDGIERAARVESTPRVKPGAELTEEIRAEIVGRAEVYQRATGASRVDLARLCGVSVYVLGMALQGDSGRQGERNRRDDVLRSLDAALAREAARANAPAKGEFVTTGVAREVFAIVKTVDLRGGMGVVYGPSGIGKTLALRAVMAKDFPSGLYVEINDSCKAPLHFYRTLLRCIRTGSALPGRVAGASHNEGVCTLAAGFSAIVARLAGSKRLIVADEADALPADTLNAIRQIHDATGCPVVLAGRPLLVAKLKRSQRDERIGGSIVGRICIQRDLLARSQKTGGRDGERLFSVEEVAEMLGKYTVRIERGAIKFLTDLANLTALGDGVEGGGLRYAISVFEIAMIANPGKPLITLEMVRQANRLAMGDDVTAETDRQVQQLYAPRTA